MPQLLVRFYSIKNDKMLRLGTVIVTVGASVALLPYLNGAVARVLVPELASADQAIPALTALVLNDWGGALFLAGVVAAGMSTFAGVLIIISSSMVRDVWVHGLKRELDPAAELKANRYMSLGVGVISLLIALKPPALVLVPDRLFLGRDRLDQPLALAVRAVLETHQRPGHLLEHDPGGDRGSGLAGLAPPGLAAGLALRVGGNSWLCGGNHGGSGGHRGGHLAGQAGSHRSGETSLGRNRQGLKTGESAIVPAKSFSINRQADHVDH